MQPTTEILARLNQNSKEHPEEVFTRLYRYLLRPDLYYIAYKHLYANSGAATKGVIDDTADGFSEAKIAAIIKALADGTYAPNPVRRTYIQKSNGRSDRWVSQPLRINWCKKSYAWYWNQFMSQYFWTVHTVFVQDEAVIPR